MFANPVVTDVFIAVVALLGAPLAFRTIRAALAGQFATDVVATLSITGALVLRQPFVGLVIVVMQAGGEALERYAARRASAAVSALESAAPQFAHVECDGVMTDVAVSAVRVGDLLLVRPGELVPNDGLVIDGASDLDTSTLTGESVPRRAAAGVEVLSGMTNGMGSFRMRATAIATESQYARIVELVRAAQAAKAPLQRLADRYAVWFTPLTIVVCVIAFAATHDWMRVLAILVAATPCPLILAVPVGMVGGISRAAAHQIIVRDGGTLERLSRVNVAVVDKTGTLTVGRPALEEVRAMPAWNEAELLRLAAAVEARSSHQLARVIVAHAAQRDVPLDDGRDVVETPGSGATGIVGDHTVSVGSRAYILERCAQDAEMTALESTPAALLAYVAVDGHFAGIFTFADTVRPELHDVLSSLRAGGIHRIVLLSGDHAPIARALADAVGIDEAHGDCLPGDKAAFIQRLRDGGDVVMMVGDGVNDAPALSSADVGIALASHGRGITTEAADVVILVDSLDRIPECLDIGRRTIRIVKESIWVGLGLSFMAMGFAAFGWLTPLMGAGAQELIDVGVIFNALRASGRGSHRRDANSGHVALTIADSAGPLVVAS